MVFLKSPGLISGPSKAKRIRAEPDMLDTPPSDPAAGPTRALTRTTIALHFGQDLKGMSWVLTLNFDRVPALVLLPQFETHSSIIKCSTRRDWSVNSSCS